MLSNGVSADYTALLLLLLFSTMVRMMTIPTKYAGFRLLHPWQYLFLSTGLANVTDFSLHFPDGYYFNILVGHLRSIYSYFYLSSLSGFGFASFYVSSLCILGITSLHKI